ncbi:hypothetical protein [Gordonia sp. (in: high G+C Gram-positive bacteria)]|uniref:hypothetical protein n=1 Tax=Gordonia sp. (in: high G+C Gram-positive bacteria) TaxID=84139 RepID=UPI002FD90F62
MTAPLAPVLRAAGLMTAAPARSVTVAVVPAGEPELEPEREPRGSVRAPRVGIGKRIGQYFGFGL